MARTAAAILGRDRRAQQPERPHLIQDLTVKTLFSARRDDARHQLVLRIAACSGLDQPLILGKLGLEMRAGPAN